MSRLLKKEYPGTGEMAQWQRAPCERPPPGQFPILTSASSQLLELQFQEVQLSGLYGHVHTDTPLHTRN